MSRTKDGKALQEALQAIRESGQALDLVGVWEIAEMAKVSKQAVVNWQARHESFPKPVADLHMGPVFMREDIARWLEKYRPRS